MPKIKTRRSAAKRFELTGSGKYKRRRQNLRHILTKKAPGRKMRLGQAAPHAAQRLAQRPLRKLRTRSIRRHAGA